MNKHKHLGYHTEAWTKWQPVLQMAYSNVFLWLNLFISIKILLKYVNAGLMDY